MVWRARLLPSRLVMSNQSFPWDARTVVGAMVPRDVAPQPELRPPSL